MDHILVEGVCVSPDHYIGGERITSSATFEDISPIDETLMGSVAAGGPAEVEAAVVAAQKAFPAWAALGPQGRGQHLRRLADVIESHTEELAVVETRDNGSLFKTNRESMVNRSARNFRYFAEVAERLHGDMWNSDADHTRTQNRVLYHSAGVTAIVTPWNGPLMLADYAQEAGLPRGVLNIVQGLGKDAGASLVAHPGVRRIAFTGSPATARSIGKAAAENIAPVGFELGGKSPFVIFADADIEQAVATALRQYFNAGQFCLAGTRLFVQRSIAHQFLECMSAEARKIVLGDPRQPETAVGPLITRVHLERVQGFVQRAKQDGAKVVYGGGVSERLGGLYFEPTLFVDAPTGSEILTREVFGPVLTFQTVETEEEAIALSNDTDYGLAAIVFTGNEQRAQRVSAALNAGTVWVNCYYIRDLGTPFGGNKLSGIGREGGLWSFEFYCDVQTICHRLGTFQG